MQQKIQELENSNEELLVELEQLRAMVIVDHDRQEDIYHHLADPIVFKGNSKFDIQEFQKKLRT